MAFFARPDLSNEQFKQLSGSILTLSGQTRIATVNGLTLSNGDTGNTVITADGAGVGLTDYYVMTFDPADGRIKLMESTSGTSFYDGSTPATVTVGGISGGTELSGKTISEILEELLAPTVSPSIVEPSSTFVLYPLTRIYEVGCVVSFTGYSTFNPGTISPVFCGGPAVRSSAICYYNYSYICCGTLTGITSPQTFSAISISDNSAANTITGNVCYSGGSAPLKSDGSPLPALSAGTTSTLSCVNFGIYPYYYGKVTCACPAGVGRPAVTKNLITGGTKVVATSTGTLCVNFGSTPNDYLWFATPIASASKIKWYVDALNNGNIGGAVSAGGNLFPDYDSVTGVTSSEGCWSNQTYKLYISNYQSASSMIMELRNS
jgi:hypothetical protein